MNVKMIVTAPLVIISLLCGVYCPPTEENKFPSRYPLKSCKSYSAKLHFDLPGSVFAIARSEEDPTRYCLTQTLPNTTREYCFKKGHARFLSMNDAEQMMIIHPLNGHNVTYNVTCVHPSLTQAQKFYKNMQHEEPSEKLLLMAPVSLERSGTVLANDLGLYADCFFNYVTIVMLNLDDEPILIFPTYAVTHITQSAPAEISLHIGANPDGQALYKFGFAGPLLATVCHDLLRTQCRHFGATSTTNRRPNGDPRYEQLFNRIYQSIQRLIDRNQQRISQWRTM